MGKGANATEDHRNISILEHRSKALVGAQGQPAVMTLQRNLDASQFGGRSTRDATTLTDDVSRRYGEHGRCLELRSRNAKTAFPCLAIFLLHLDKAFDLLDSSAVWWAVARLAGDASLLIGGVASWGLLHSQGQAHWTPDEQRSAPLLGRRPGLVYWRYTTLPWRKSRAQGDREAVLAYNHGPEPGDARGEGK